MFTVKQLPKECKDQDKVRAKSAKLASADKG